MKPDEPNREKAAASSAALRSGKTVAGSLHRIVRRWNSWQAVAISCAAFDLARIIFIEDRDRHWVVILSAFMLPFWTVVFMLERHQPPDEKPNEKIGENDQLRDQLTCLANAAAILFSETYPDAPGGSVLTARSLVALELEKTRNLLAPNNSSATPVRINDPEK